MANENPREEFRQITQGWLPIFDRLLQALITAITGKPHQNQIQLFEHTPVSYLLLTLAMLFGGAGASGLIVFYWSPPLFPLLVISLIITVGGDRRIEGIVNHHCVHNSFFKSKLANRCLHEALSTILLLQGYDAYVRDHIDHHRVNVLGTVQDPAFKFVLSQGFYPGKNKSDYWDLLKSKILSLNFYWLLLLDRLKDNFIECPPYRKLMSAIWLSFCLGLVVYNQIWLIFAIAWLFPLVVLHSISSLLYALTEHVWGMK